jgi:hypothetical protein
MVLATHDLDFEPRLAAWTRWRYTIDSAMTSSELCRTAGRGKRFIVFDGRELHRELHACRDDPANLGTAATQLCVRLVLDPDDAS